MGLIMQILARQHTARDPLATASAEKTLPGCSLPVSDVISSHGSKGRNFRNVVDTTQPPSGSTGLWGGPAPTTCSQILCTCAAGDKNTALSTGTGTLLPLTVTFQQAPSSATPAQACLHLALQHLASCAHTQLWPHQLLNAVLLFWGAAL